MSYNPRHQPDAVPLGYERGPANPLLKERCDRCQSFNTFQIGRTWGLLWVWLLSMSFGFTFLFFIPFGVLIAPFIFVIPTVACLLMLFVPPTWNCRNCGNRWYA